MQKKIRFLAFTLVELIVVITILSILGTIAFISLSGYSDYASRAKVNSNVASLAKMIDIKMTRGELHPKSIVKSFESNHSIANGTNTFGSSYTNTNSGIIVDEGENYSVGSVDFLKLEHSGGGFQKSESEKYIFAYVQAGKKPFFQTAGMYTKNSITKNFIKGSYFKAANSNDVAGLISAPGSFEPILHNTSYASSPSLGGNQPNIAFTPSPGPAGATPPLRTWEAVAGSTSVGLPDSLNYNNFIVNSSQNNAPISIEVGNTNNTIQTQFGADSITAGHGNNIINSSNGFDTIIVGDGFNEISIDNNDTSVTIGNGDNTITALSGNHTITVGNGDNTLSLGYGEHNITLGTGNNTITAHGDNMRISTAPSGSLIFNVGGDNGQSLIWNGGNVSMSHFYYWGNNRINLSGISDINNCSDLQNKTVLSGNSVRITSTHGTINIQNIESYGSNISSDPLNCAQGKVIF